MRGVAATREPRRLVVTADDFGLTTGINRGISEAVAAGTVSAASLMATVPAFDDAVRLAHAAGDRVGVGLHVTLTLGRPLTAARGLTDPATGEFLSFPRLLTRALRGRLRAGEVEAECEAQLARCQAAGVRLTHVDGHHHVHVLPGVREAVRRVAAGTRICVVRDPREPLVGTVFPWRRLPARVALRFLSRGAGPGRPRAPCRADHFRGPSLLGAERFAKGLLRLLDTLPPGTTELMVHPGYVDGPLPGGDPYAAPRERELAALLSPEVRMRLHAGEIQLVHFGQLCSAAEGHEV